VYLRATGRQCTVRFHLSQDRNNSVYWTAMAGGEPAGARNVEKRMTG